MTLTTPQVDRPHRPIETVSSNVSLLGELLLERAAATPDVTAAFQKMEGKWRSWSWAEWRDRSLGLAQGFATSTSLMTPGGFQRY